MSGTLKSGTTKAQVKLGGGLRRFLRDERGTETLEWGLVCGLIIIGGIAAVVLIGPKITDMWNDVNNEIPPKE